MKKMSKILTVILLVALCVSLFTVQAFAKTHDETCEKTGDFSKDYISYPAVDATCTSEGREAYAKCKTCGQLIDLSTGGWVDSVDDVTKIDKLDHDLQDVAKVDANCDHTGVEAHKKCSMCGNLFDSEGNPTSEGALTIPKTLHTPGATQEAKDATCKEDGNVEYAVCTVCGKYCDTAGGTLDSIVISKSTVAHTFASENDGWVVVKEPTASQNGLKRRVCTVCGYKEELVLPATGVTDGEYTLDYVTGRDTWYRGEEPLSFQSDLIYLLNTEKKVTQNFVGVRIGNSPSFYSYTYDCLDFYSSGRYITLGKNQMNNLDAGTYYIWVYDLENPNRYTNTRVFYVVDTPSLEPINTDKHVVNSTKNLRFLASEPIVPGSVKVGGKSLLDPNYYYVSNDGLTITLSPDFLNERQPGTFTISANTQANGTKVSCPFYILSTASGGSTSPRTGDESQLGLWAAFLLLSGAAVVVLVPKIRKHRA